MTARTVTLFAVGDLIVGPEGDRSFDFVAPALANADLVVGQLEVPYTQRDAKAVSLHRDPALIGSVLRAGFDVLTLAGNHLMDSGVAGIEDTLSWLAAHHVPAVGAGMNREEARRPVMVERDSTRFGFLAYNCVGPRESWAEANKPGCAYVHVITHYEENYASPGGPPAIYTWAESKTFSDMVRDVRELRRLCDVLCVSFHMGIGHTPVKIAEYEHQVSHGAIDAGADVVLAHHAHILKGIQLYKGKPIFHGLGNFVTWAPNLMPKPGDDVNAWSRKRWAVFGFEPDPDYPAYPFHPEARNTIIARLDVAAGKIARVSYLPCIVDRQARPHVVERGAGAEEVFIYVERITRAAELNARFDWDGNQVRVFE